jgi:glycosyltransferase involved in cell wall biosynthesis
MNKRITIISDDFPSPGRPVFVFVQQLVFALVDQGVKVNVVAPQSLSHALLRGEKLRPRFSNEKTNNGNLFEVYRPFSISFGLGHRILYKIASKFNNYNLTKTLDAIQPEILYGHFWHNANLVREYSIKHRLPAFVACGEGDDALEELVENLSADEKKSLSNVVKGVICVSSENKRKCLEYLLSREDNTIVLPNCVDDSLFHPMDASNMRNQLGATDDDFVVSFTGAFIKRKGAKVLSDAIKMISDPQIKLIFMGKVVKGDESVPDCPGIVYMSSTEHDKMPEFLNASNVFVLPTLKEGCCNAIVEALACGIPVISSNRPFNDDILNDDNSIVVDPERADEVAAAINKMKNDKMFYAKKKKYTVQNSNQYSIVERAKKVAAFINEILAE